MSPTGSKLFIVQNDSHNTTAKTDTVNLPPKLIPNWGNVGVAKTKIQGQTYHMHGRLVLLFHFYSFLKF